MLDILRAFVLSFFISSAMGVVYFASASLVVNFFGLNRGLKPVGFWFLNCAVVMTVVTFFVSFALMIRN